MADDPISQPDNTDHVTILREDLDALLAHIYLGDHRTWQFALIRALDRVVDAADEQLNRIMSSGVQR